VDDIHTDPLHHILHHWSLCHSREHLHAHSCFTTALFSPFLSFHEGGSAYFVSSQNFSLAVWLANDHYRSYQRILPISSWTDEVLPTPISIIEWI